MLAVLHAGQDFAFRRAITSELIGNNHAWDVVQPLEEFAKKSLGSLRGSRRLCTRMSSTLPSWSTARHKYCLSPRIVRKTSSICHVSPQRGRRRRSSLAYVCPNAQTPLSHGFIAHDNSPLCVVRSSTSRKLSEKRKYSQTAWLMISVGKRWPL